MQISKVDLIYFTCVFICLLIHSDYSWSQGLRIIFSDASRLIFRLSSSSGMRATIRLYAESYERDPSGHDQEPQVPKQSCAPSTVCFTASGKFLELLYAFSGNDYILESKFHIDTSSWRTNLRVTTSKFNSFIEVFSIEQLFSSIYETSISQMTCLSWLLCILLSGVTLRGTLYR